MLVAIDGKTLRGRADKRIKISAIHMVRANWVVLGQVKTDDKPNEITAIPELLKLLELKGCLVSIDAMGCQRKIAQQIVKSDADHLLAVKGSQRQSKAVKGSQRQSKAIKGNQRQSGQIGAGLL